MAEVRTDLMSFGRGYFTSMRRDTLQALAEDFARVAVEYGVKVSVRCYPPYGNGDPQPDPIVDVWREPEAE